MNRYENLPVVCTRCRLQWKTGATNKLQQATQGVIFEDHLGLDDCTVSLQIELRKAQRNRAALDQGIAELEAQLDAVRAVATSATPPPIGATAAGRIVDASGRAIAPRATGVAPPTPPASEGMVAGDRGAMGEGQDGG